MQKLTDSDVEKLHRLAKQGLPKNVIAARFHVHRNTITAHLSGRVAYSPDLVLRLGSSPSSPSPPPDQFLTIYQAAALLPDQPSPTKVYKLARAGTLRTEVVEFRSYGAWRKLCTKLEWVRECALAMFPAGLYYRSDSLYIYADRTLDLLDALRTKRYESPLVKRREVSYYPAPTVHAVARALDLRISVPAYRIRIAVLGLDTVGSHVI